MASLHFDIFEFPSLLEWRPIARAILITVLAIVLIIGMLIKGLFIKYIMFHAPRKRPINTLMMVEQSLILLATTILGIGKIISMATGKSLLDLFGSNACLVYWASMVTYGCMMATGGFCMALFRWICIMHNDKAKYMGLEKVKNLVIATEVIIIGISCMFFSLTLKYGSAPLSMSFCQDKSVMYLDHVSKHASGSNAGQVALTLILIFQQGLGILELLMYVFIFKHLKNHDEKKVQGLTKDIIQRRTKRNVITLSGQAWTFGIETILSIFLHVSINWESAASIFFSPQITPFYVILISSAVSFGQFFTSPEMRRFYLKLEA